jgi:hypothetical protein
MRVHPLILSVLALACSSGRADSKQSGRSAAASARVVVFSGTCDASGAVPIDARRFAVADDEDNVLRIYDADRGGAPLYTFDLSPDLRLTKKKNWPESDLEAATRVGDVALWLSSHARSKKGKLKPDRFRFFSTDVPRAGQPVALRGDPYTELLRDLLAEPKLSPFGLAHAADLPPQIEGGLNIEGMTAMPDGQVLLGFRNPVPGGRALLVAMVNPLDAFAGKPLRFGQPISLDLHGLGVRALSHWRGQYLIAAGDFGDGGDHRLYRWPGPGSAPAQVDSAALVDLNPEAFFTPEERDEFMLLSDDGSVEQDGERCKDLADPDRKHFRGLWMRPHGGGARAASAQLGIGPT